MIDISKIKLVVWDLDDTFWKGTVSEEKIVPIPENIQFVKDLTDCGIINSVCSKNDEDVAVDRLKELDVWEYFVFSSINWNNKAVRLNSMIDSMALRPANVLFLDDNTFNLQEAKHMMPELMIGEPSDISKLIQQVQQMDKKDTAHKRLKQYKVLEEKKLASMEYSSNENFLFSTNIQVEMCEDCKPELSRIHELLMRSNQLNFTKKRIPIEELETIIKNDAYRCGYVKVKDKFGDYGLVGFYAVKDGVAEHFFFSCRTMGQFIEQWVYAQLGFPDLEIAGEVRTQLNQTDCPKWINQKNQGEEKSSNFVSSSISHKILVKGPCDLSRSCMYMQGGEWISTEMTYVRDGGGQTVFYQNHSAGIVNIVSLSNEEKATLARKCKYIDPKAFKTEMFNGLYDVVFLSTLMESNHGIYRQKNGKGYVVIGNYNQDITSKDLREQGVNEGYSGYKFSTNELEQFSADFEFTGYTTSERYVAFLEMMMEKLPIKTTLCLILGATTKWGMDLEKGRMHEDINHAVKEFAKTHSRVKYIDIDECIEDLSDFEREGYLDHYQARVYYKIAQAMLKCATEMSGFCGIKMVSTRTLWLDDKLNRIKVYFNKEGRLYKILLYLYCTMTGRKTITNL